MRISPKSALLMVLSALATTSGFSIETPPASPTDTQTGLESEGLPSLGKWMVDENGVVAHWLGDKFDGKTLDEPINVVIRIRSPNEIDALAALLYDANKAGFFDRFGHSDHYTGTVNGESVGQVYQAYKLAFSDASFLQPNNHGRVFGPVKFGEFIYFTGAFSREGYQKTGPRLWNFSHPYLSFNQARDEFVKKLLATSRDVSVHYIPMDNEMSADALETTGDHDGQAALIDLSSLKL